MALINLRNMSLAFGGPRLFEDISLRIAKGERICLLGRNGTGKSTLLKLIAGELQPDAGVIDRQQGLRVARLEQDVPRDLRGTIYEATAQGLGSIGRLLGRYHDLGLRMERGEANLQDDLAELQNQLDSCQGWAHQRAIEQVLSRLKLPADQPVASLSGGMLRRVLLARALAAEPDILLLDWEYACDNDPLFDIAVVVAHHGLSAGQADVLLDACFDADGDSWRHQLGIQQRLYSALNWLWAAAAAAASGV